MCVFALSSFADPAEPPNLVKLLNDQLANVAEKVSASVVVISVEKTSWAGGEEGGEMPYDFYRDYGQPRRNFPRRKMPEGQGSGFILRKDGYILTNNHVIENASKITVRLNDGRSFPAKVRGIDDKTDIAVIQIDAKGLTPARMGDSDKVRVGELVIAIGTPYSLDYTVTAGVISQKNRSGLGMASYEDFLQTDAKINPGNSGGPLVNINGEVIGVNTLIRGLRTDIGFAIPINMAREISERLIKEGKIVRPWVGIGFKYLSADKQLQEYLAGSGREVVVDMIHPNAPASKSTLRPADIIIAVNGVPITSPKDVQNEVLKTRVGDEVTFDVRREDKLLKIKIPTTELPSESPAPASTPPSESKQHEREEPGIGITVQSLSQVPIEQFDVKDTKGVFVSGTDFGGPADLAGLQHGDIITAVDRNPIESVEEYEAAIKKADLSRGVLVFFNRQGTLTYALIQTPRAP